MMGCDFQGADCSNGIIAGILGGRNKLSAAGLRGALPAGRGSASPTEGSVPGEFPGVPRSRSEVQLFRLLQRNSRTAGCLKAYLTCCLHVEMPRWPLFSVLEK